MSGAAPNGPLLFPSSTLRSLPHSRLVELWDEFPDLPSRMAVDRELQRRKDEFDRAHGRKAGRP